MSDGVMYCAKHPKTQTALTCASCGIPICPQCMVSTPVGMKCRACGTSRASALFKVRPERIILAAAAALAAGAIAGTVGSSLGFFTILLAFPYGYFAGGIILKASGMKRGLTLEVVAGAGMVLGGILAKIFPLALAVGVASLGLLLCPTFWIAVGISAACAVSKIRHL